MSDEVVDTGKERLTQAAMGGELPHQQKERNHDQIVVGEARIGQVFQGAQQRVGVSAGEVDIASGADREHGDPDRNADH